jgi:outer membrane protein OmpA-like peptidoglycan-associated protein
MKSATRSLVRDAARRGADWQPPAAAEKAAQRSARLATGRDGTDTGVAPAAPLVTPAAGAEIGAGRPLQAAERTPLESRLQADFSGVRVHTGGPASQAAEDLGARAFAHGGDIAFAPGEYAPQRPAAQQLLAHELTHVAQQARAGATALQFDPRKDKAGIGAAPPEDDFIKAPNDWGAEDSHVLFKQDQADPDGGEAAIRQVVDAVQEPRYVHVHGYASEDGPADYNLNLSAHRGATLKHRLEAMLPPGARVFIFAHGQSTHFGGPAQNRRVGLSVLGPVGGDGLRPRHGLGGRYRLGSSPPEGPYLTPPDPASTTPILPDPNTWQPGGGPQPAPFLAGGPIPSRRPRSLMDNSALLLPGGLHGLDTGSAPAHWDAAFDKYHALGLPDEREIGPIDLGAGELANKEVKNAEQAYHERNDPSVIDRSNAETGTHVFTSPNLLDHWPFKKKKKKGRD